MPSQAGTGTDAGVCTHTYVCAHSRSDTATATSPKNRFCPTTPTPAKSRAGLEHHWDLAGAFRAALLAQSCSKPGSSSSPSQGSNGCEQSSCTGPALPGGGAQRSPRGQAVPPPRAKGIRLERSSTVPSPRRRQPLQAEAARGETGAAKLRCFSWSYFSSSPRENEEK